MEELDGLQQDLNERRGRMATMADVKKNPELSELLSQMDNKPKKKRSREDNPRRRKILDWARDHNLVIHPGAGYDYYIDSFNQFNACPCDLSRPDCPCPESVEECKEKGHCKCRLFWRSHDDFKDKMLGKEK